MKETKKLLIKCSRKENPQGGQNYSEEGVTRGRVEQRILKMTESVSGGRIEGKLTEKDKGNLLLAEYSERWRVRGVGA